MDEHNSQGVVSTVKSCPNHNLTDTQIHYSTPAYISHQSVSSLRLFSSSVEENCSQKEIYTPYKDPHSVTNSFIESQSIDTALIVAALSMRQKNLTLVQHLSQNHSVRKGKDMCHTGVQTKMNHLKD